MIAYKYRSGRGPEDSNGKDVVERDIELLSQESSKDCVLQKNNYFCIK